jgi:NADH-quinone oxidoreductase subunit M
MYQRVIWGEITNPKNETLPDLFGREKAMLIPILILVFWMGMYSNHFLRPMDASVARLMGQVAERGSQYAVAEPVKP